MFDQAQLDEFFVLWMEYRLMKQRESIALNTNGDHKDDRMLEIYDLQVTDSTHCVHETLARERAPASTQHAAKA